MDESRQCNNQKLKEVNLKPTVPMKWRIEWRNAAPLILMHLATPYSIYLVHTEAKWQTNLFAYLLYVFAAIGNTAGAHRLWTHRTYKAKLPLQIILLILSTLNFQGSVLHWVRDHRLHHKYTDTDADPHNSRRGFFFSHIGWLMVKKHPEVRAKGRAIDISDLQSQPLLQLQHRYYLISAILLCFVAPSYIPTLWGENVWTAFFVAGNLRLIISEHVTFFVNSAAHIWGTKPYDKYILPTENLLVSAFAAGEGFHNYHHTFPQDYRAAELGGYFLNIARLFIDIMAKIGWAYDLNVVSGEMIKKRVRRSGDGTHPVWKSEAELYTK